MRVPKKTIVVIALAVMVASLIQCTGNGSKKQATTNSSDTAHRADIAAGKALAAQYCQSCHKLPDPSLLDKATWRNNVLPYMGTYLGIKDAGLAGASSSVASDLDYLPDSALLPTVQWRQLIAYYIANAPEHLPVPNIKAPAHQLPGFEIQFPSAEWFLQEGIASYVKIDTSVSPHRLIVNDGISNTLAVFDDKLQTLGVAKLNGALVDMAFQKNNTITATNIGKDLWANNLRNGNIKTMTINKKGIITTNNKPLFDNLARPVALNVVDLNGDGRKDYLIAQFGKMVGRLSWMEDTGHGFEEHILRKKSGAVKTIIDDVNKDGRPDIWALFAQGDEGIFLYKNNGKGQFEEQRVLTFPPVYGSSSFDLVDLNGDGFKDIIYTCGDNGDNSQISKPYHGLYIYLNDGKNSFSQKYFYPINGCYKAIAKDFDGDGDLDIATISDFPAPDKSWQAFIYFENKGNFNYETYTLPLKTPFGKVLTMDAGNIDGDDKTDLILGDVAFNADPKNPIKKPLFIVLKNISAGAAGASKKSKG